MYYSLKGIIREIKDNKLVIDVHDICYEVLIPSTSLYKENDIVTIYTHLVKKEDEEFLVGFFSLSYKEAYLKLISVVGIGSKTAVNILSKLTPHELYEAIDTSNILMFKKIKGIGSKTASQIILSLKGKLINNKDKSNNVTINKEIIDILKSLGFKDNEIINALNSINIINMSKEEILKSALITLRK